MSKDGLAFIAGVSFVLGLLDRMDASKRAAVIRDLSRLTVAELADAVVNEQLACAAVAHLN